MSYDAIRWALSQPVGKSSAKFLLVAMADCINAEAGDMLCWPSNSHLAQVTGQDAKTVEAGTRRLRDAGYITDTGTRKGTTGQVIVYRLNTTENGGVDTGGKTPVFPTKTPVFPVKDPQISHETPPKTGYGTRKEPGIEPGRNQDARLRALPPGLLADYLPLRKAKKAGEFTTTAVDMMEREGAKVGLNLEDTMRYCVGAAWQGFNAGWWRKREQPESAKSGGEPLWRKENRERVQQAAPGVAAQTYTDAADFFMDVEATDVTTRQLG